MAKWINEQGEAYDGMSVVAGGRRYLSPSDRKLEELGYRKVEDEVQDVEPTKEERIRALKQQLFASDYKALKYAEGWISAEEYAPIKAERQALRDEINELESKDGE